MPIQRRDLLKYTALSTIMLPIGAACLEVRATADDLLRRPTMPNEEKLPVISVIFDGAISQRDSFDAREYPSSDQHAGLDTYAPSTSSDAVFTTLFSNMSRVVDQIAVCRNVLSKREPGFHAKNSRLLLLDKNGINWHARLATSEKESGHPYYYLPMHHWDIGVMTNNQGSPLRSENDKFHHVHEAFSFDEVHQNRGSALNRRRLRERLNLAQQLDTPRFTSDALDNQIEMQRQAVALLLGDAKKFVSDPPPSALSRYGAQGLPYYYAGELVKQGAASVVVRVGSWDFHKHLYQSMSVYAPEFDKGFTALIEDLEAGNIPPTVVSCVGEFGRTPKFSGTGRDHFEVGTGLLYGGNIAPGVYGSTDYHGFPEDDSALIETIDWRNVVFSAANRSELIDNTNFVAPKGLIVED